ncbi:helix-turn-helix domain-containing protein [Streptomyces fulvoviolaceus]|uniref:helix-turn-helix domain-containing protein n=1 Tax=Streptomyces fulvoviolaceus TaxID=285535 RepID=UPI0021BE7AE3|nr:helix-turn-helix transcriptional regulator [Streptomyces fulvoviolaceus]MCT9083420.1 helix-turn-helix transcriptional regulator [Streptomyces fulvoviolaceus]
MGRPEKPIATLNLGLLALAGWLREIRINAQLTYVELAAMTGNAYSATTLQRAASGERVPRLPVVEAYAVACDQSLEQARRRWRHARAVEHSIMHVLGSAPRPRLVENAAELRAALREMYHRAGAMPLREMERRAGLGRLPRSTMRRMLDGTTMLSKDQMLAFLTVCDVPEREHQDWLDALSRVWDKRHSWYDNELFKNLNEPAEQFIQDEQNHRIERKPPSGRGRSTSNAGAQRSQFARGGPANKNGQRLKLGVTTTG